MTEKITDTDEIEELAYKILGEEGSWMRLGELMGEFRVHDTDAPVLIVSEALTESDRITESDGYWRIDQRPK